MGTLSITNAPASVISAQAGCDTSSVQFQATDPLVRWEFRAGGAGYGQGTLVEEGAYVSMTGTRFDAHSWTAAQFDALGFSAANLTHDIVLAANTTQSGSITASELVGGDGDYVIHIYGENPGGSVIGG